MNNIGLVSEIIMYGMFVVLAISFGIMPFVGRKNLAFGVSIPKSEYESAKIKNARKQFLLWVIIIPIMALAILFFCKRFFGESTVEMMYTILLLAQIVGYGTVYYFIHKKIKKLKIDAGWQQDAQEIMVADTTFFESNKAACSPKWFWTSALIIAITAVMGVVFYDRIPEQIPMQMNMAGEIADYAEKSVVSVFFPVIMQLLMLGVFRFVHYTFKRTPPVIDADHAKESARQNMIFRYRWSVFLVISGAGLMLIFGILMAVNIGFLPTQLMFAITMSFVGLIVLYAIMLSLTTGQSGSRVKPFVTEEGIKINRDDDRYWKAGSFYFNKEDPAMFVEKRFGIGTTVNFGNAWAVVIFVGIILLIVGVTVVINLLM